MEAGPITTITATIIAVRVPARRAARWLLVTAPLLLTACQPAVLDPQGFVGVSERTILIDSMAIMLAIVLPTITAILAFAWWFRASNTRAKYRPEWTYSGQIELMVWGIPFLTIMLLGGVTWVSSHALDPAQALKSDAKPLEIQAVSLDWKWLFVYPGQGVASVNQLWAPVNVPLHFTLTSASVMNAFFIPQLGSMIYTMNGMASELNLIADQPGVFAGLSSHYSGDGFSDMHFEVHAVPDAEFTAWVATTRKDGPALNAASYAQLTRQSAKVTPFTYRDVDPDLFQKIVTQAIAPAAGPQAAPGGLTVSNLAEP